MFKLFPVTPEYEINSAPTFIVPDAGNPTVEVSVISVPEPPVPAVLSDKVPFKVFTTPEAPPHVEAPQP